MTFKATILGCGNSTGVPAIGNYWGACDPAEPKNRRSRCSLLVQSQQTSVVIDTGPDFREQLSRVNVQTVDGVLYSHHHGDHVNGIDELRVNTFRRKTITDVYGNSETMQDLQRRFDYMFIGGVHELYPPMLQANELSYGQSVLIGDLEFISFEQDHGSCTSTGYRFGDLGYSVDIVNLDAGAIDALRGIKTWIVDAAAYHQDESPVHASLNTIYKLNEQIGAPQVYLTSLSLAMDYKTLCDELPAGYAPAYDGLEITFNGR